MSNGVDAGEEQKDPRKKDYAIVVGVSRYPKLTREGGTPADLDGPINDALKVREWLGRDDGGGVPLENVEYVVRQPVTPAVAPDPTRDTIVQAFAQMYARCWQPNGAPIVPSGSSSLCLRLGSRGSGPRPRRVALLEFVQRSLRLGRSAPFDWSVQAGGFFLRNSWYGLTAAWIGPDLNRNRSIIIQSQAIASSLPDPYLPPMRHIHA